MVPNRLARALSRLHDSVTRSRVVGVLGPLRLFSTESRPDIPALLECFAAWSAAQGQFAEPERALMQALGLGALGEAAWWGRIVTATTRSAMPDDLAATVMELTARLQVVADGFPALAGLLEASSAVGEAEANGLVLSVPGRDGEAPGLARVASAIEGLNQLWTVAEDLTGQRGALHLLAIDPGPAMALFFDGPADPLIELRSLLVTMWEQAARLPAMPFEQHAALVPGMLPVMDRIGRSVRADSLRVRATLESGVRKLLESGCSLRGLDLSLAETGHAGPPDAVRQGLAPAVLPGPALPANDKNAPQGLSETDMTHLAHVIAEERQQLQHAETPRRLWHGAGASRTS